MKNLCFVILSCLFSKIDGQVSLSASLVACYDLNGNAQEAINALTGTLNSVSSTTDRNGQANSAINFAGTTSSFIRLPNSSFLKPQNELSFSAWVKPTLVGSTTSQEILFTKNTYDIYFSAYALTIQSLNNNMVFKGYRQDGSGSDIVNSTTALSSGVWYHVVFTINNNNMKLYVNGVLEGTCTSTSNYNYDQSSFVILGGTDEYVNPPYTGAMDNVRFYNRTLNLTDALTLYSEDPICSAKGEVTGIVAVKQPDENVSIFPNPVLNNVMIKFNSRNTVEFALFNIIGQKLESGSIDEQLEIEMKNLTKGVYFLKLNFGDKVVTKKIIKE